MKPGFSFNIKTKNIKRSFNNTSKKDHKVKGLKRKRHQEVIPTKIKKIKKRRR